MRLNCTTFLYIWASVFVKVIAAIKLEPRITLWWNFHVSTFRNDQARSHKTGRRGNRIKLQTPKLNIDFTVFWVNPFILLLTLFLFGWEFNLMQCIFDRSTSVTVAIEFIYFSIRISPFFSINFITRFLRISQLLDHNYKCLNIRLCEDIDSQ